MNRFIEALKYRVEWPLRSMAIRVLSHPIWGHFLPFIPNGSRSWYAYDEPGDDHCDNGIPIPPKHLYEDLCDSEQEFLESGQRLTNTMAAAVARHQAGKMDKVLDFGCGVGRMTRWLKQCLNCGEVYGTDIDSTRASWCVNNLGSVGRFWTQTTHPHLPIADATFDLIICGSVFTHIDDLSEAWLLELARTLRKGGLIYITLHDEKAMQWLQEHEPQAWILRKMRSNPAAYRALGAMPRKLVVGRFNRSQVFYQRRYFIESLRRDFTHVESMEQAYGFQTGQLFRRN